MADFLTFYEGAILGVHRHAIYDLSNQIYWLNQIIQPLHVDRAWGVPYPPPFVLLLSPMGYFPLEPAYTAWKFLSLIIGAGGIYLLLKLQTRFRSLDRAVILIAAIANTPGIYTIRTGQFSYFLTAIVSAYIWALIRQRPIIAGVCLGLVVCVKPQYALFFCLPALIGGRWKLLAVAALFVSVMAIAAGLCFGWAVYPQWLHYLYELEAVGTDRIAGNFPEFQVNLRALILYRWLHWTSSGARAIFTYGAMLVGLTYSAWLWLQVRKRPQLFGWAMALTLTLSLLCGPHAHHHDCLFLCLAAVLTLPSISFFDVFKVEDWSYRLWCMVLMLYPLLSFITFSLAAVYDIKWETMMASNVLLALGAGIYFAHLVNGKSPPDPASSKTPEPQS